MDKKKIEEAVSMIIEAIGEDPKREGLIETPQRVARMYEEVFSGIGKDASIHLSKTFEYVNDNIVVVKDIEFFSMCEHHFLPVHGKAHIAYIPTGRVAGLSKLARTVETYARRPQLQERLNLQVAEAMMNYLKASGVLVVVEAEHMCMTMRGVRNPSSLTVTSVALGEMEKDLDLRNEAYRLIGI